MEAIGQLGAGVAHNFNNLLQGIHGSLELAGSGFPAETRRYLGDAMDMSRRGAAIVKQLLVLTRKPVDEGRIVFDFANVVENAYRVCLSTFDRKITIPAGGGFITASLRPSGTNRTGGPESVPECPGRHGRESASFHGNRSRCPDVAGQRRCR